MIAARIIGHRGASSLAPENTLAAIRAGANAGVLWVEIDVRLLGDGTAVVHHDKTVDRCTDGTGLLSHYDRMSIRRLDAGRWFGDEFAGERIPLLPEALALIRDLGLGVNLELKATSRSAARRLGAVVVGELTTAVLPWEGVLVSSFEPAALEASRKQARSLLIGCIWSRLPRDWRQQAATLGAVSIHCNWRYLTERTAHAVKAAGFELYCYTVNNSSAFLPYWEWGVDGIFTDRPQDFLVSGPPTNGVGVGPVGRP
ncbi:glycerophosphoryl diester phosphodiesterase [Nitrococcus mobilis]|uniref:Glycerophosphoryl diester phosphodiesterase, putative n=1 Tax=Nitrococcus mobilis Nb-231 TaxID=314278 RepID=A4BVC9_9GAMM|nr:glycerophosphoryl diester phosphodiesterase [Nitrococcus mobilis]EAR20314.1 glycerophosphoryl diester phosphodiesterase, putative [Nitrococcus mobilis Nb-231]